MQNAKVAAEFAVTHLEMHPNRVNSMKIKNMLQGKSRPKTGGFSTRNQSLLEKLSQHSS